MSVAPTVEFRFDPNQPRDAAGKWTKGSTDWEDTRTYSQGTEREAEVAKVFSGQFEVDGRPYVVETVTTRDVYGDVKLEGRIRDPSRGPRWEGDTLGDEVGKFQRTVKPDGRLVNDVFIVEDEYQNKGIGTAFLDYTEERAQREFGTTEIEVDAVEIGRYAWAARGYGTYDTGAVEEWVAGARRAVANGALGRDNENYRRFEAVMADWEARVDAIEAVYPADLLAISPRFRDVLLEGPTWSGVRFLEPLTASAAIQVFRFDPSQPRDEAGRWTDAGGTALRAGIAYRDDYGTLEIRETGVDRIRQAVYMYPAGEDVFDVVVVENDDGTVSVEVENLYGADGTIEGEAALEQYLSENGIDDVSWDGERGTLHASHEAAVKAGEDTGISKLFTNVESTYSGAFETESGESFTIDNVRVVDRSVGGNNPVSVEVTGEILDSNGETVGKFTRAVYDDGVVFNHSLYIRPDRLGEGIGTAFLDQTEAELGASEYRIGAVSVGKYAWAARGYRLDPSGGSTLAASTRDQWAETARARFGDLAPEQAAQAEAVLRSWSDDLNNVYPADLLAVDRDAFRDVFLEGPSWDGIRRVDDDDRLVASAGFGVEVLASGMPAQLRDYWLNGEGAARIAWGSDGDFTRCVSALSEHVSDPQGICANLHYDANGFWPGDKRNLKPDAETGLDNIVVFRLSEFHLQGQHDQQSHAGGNGSPKSSIPEPSAEELEWRRNTREVPFLPHPRAGFTSKRAVFRNDRWLLVHAEDGTALRIEGGTKTTTQERLDMVNALADAYDANPVKAVDKWGEPVQPRITILDEDDWDQGDRVVAYVMPGLDPAKFDIHSGVAAGLGPRDREPYRILVNDNPDVWTEDALVEFRKAAMPELANTSPRAYVITHEYGHVRMALGDDNRDEVSRIGGAVKNRGWMGMSEYGQSNQAESHAEAFAEWTLSGGKTTNQAARLYARDLRWPGAPALSERIEEPLAASAGGISDEDFLRQPIICADSPQGAVLTFAEDLVMPGVEVFHLSGQHDQQTHAGGRGSSNAPNPVQPIDAEHGWTHLDQWGIWEHPKWGSVDDASVAAGRDTLPLPEEAKVVGIGDSNVLVIDEGYGSVVAYEVHSEEFWRPGGRNPIGRIDSDRKVVGRVDVLPSWRRRGVATGIWKHARTRYPDLQHSSARTDDGKAWINALEREGLAVQVFRFDPNQPRDSDGRWTDTGGGSSSEVLDAAEGIDDLDGELVDAPAEQIVERFKLNPGDVEAPTTSGGRLYQAQDGTYVALDPEGADTYVTTYSDLYDAESVMDLDALETQVEESWREDAARSTVYHGTRSDETATSIAEGGIQRRNETRGVNNRWVGAAVYTTTDYEQAAKYGQVFEVDLQRAIADGVISADDLSREPGYNRADAMSMIANGFDDYSFDAYSQFYGTGEDPFTVVISADIPPEYLRREIGYGEGFGSRIQVFRFDPNQPRDEAGRWTDAGGVEYGPDGIPTDPTIRDDGTRFEHDSVASLVDQYDSADEFRQAQRMKHEGAARVTEMLDEDRRAEISYELNGMTMGDQQVVMELMLYDVENNIRMFGINQDRLPVGVAMQVSSLTKAWDAGLVETNYEASEALQGAVERFHSGGDANELSRFIEDTYGISVSHGAVDWRNSQWQQSAVTPPMVAFHLAAADRKGLGAATAALRGYYPSGSYDLAEKIRRMIPSTIANISSADEWIIDDTIRMNVRRDNRDTITVYRGVKDTGHAATNYENATVTQGNPLTSWTTSEDIARDFGGQFSTNGGWVMRAEVPISQIAGIATVNGMGSVREREVILYGEPIEIDELTPVNK